MNASGKRVFIRPLKIDFNKLIVFENANFSLVAIATNHHLFTHTNHRLIRADDESTENFGNASNIRSARLRSGPTENLVPEARAESCSGTPAPWIRSPSFRATVDVLQQSETLLSCSVRPYLIQVCRTSPVQGRNQVADRLSLTLLTRPSNKKTDRIFDPPELISGRGIPATGIRPTTIPTLTST